MLEKLFAAANAVKAGEILKNPATWKNRQMLMNSFLIIIAVIPQFVNVELSESDMNSIAFGLATLGGAVNTYLTAATSVRVGI